jgi:hypothetical protein
VRPPCQPRPPTLMPPPPPSPGQVPPQSRHDLEREGLLTRE